MVLRSIEQKIEALVEGVFGRAFRTNVQPIEVARKLGKEMDDHRSISVSRVYVPNEYTVFLSPPDREQFDGYERQLLGELQEYLAEHAKREEYALLSSPKVQLETDEDLEVGEFGIAVRMVQPDRRHERELAAESADAGATMIYKPAPGLATEAGSPAELGVARELVTLSGAGETYAIKTRKAVIGRSKDCDIQVPDANVSRRHAELRQEGTAYWVVDLDSTNGIEVNGRRVKRAKLENGATITLGSTDLVFKRELE